uniref:Lysozyme n=1 Tax=Strongyloides venezuelensis TaxID=75913 RepID=A0A0K0EZ57_STRVS
MIYKVITPFLLLSTVFVSTNAEYLNAIDVSESLFTPQINCIKSNGYSAIFTQVYAGSDGVDETGIENIINAYKGDLGVEVYILPYPKGLPSDVQFDDTYKRLKSANIDVRTIWLKVTNQQDWIYLTQENINFIQSMIIRARNYGVTLGIYTNWYDWYQITGNTTAFQQFNLPLWYWDTYGYGLGAESLPNFNDFRGFGSWKSATVKEYGLKEFICSSTLSKIVYSKSSSFMKFKGDKNMTQPVAGSAIF